MEILHRRRSLFRNRPPAADDWVFPSLSRDHQRIVPIGGWDRAKGLIKREATIAAWSLHDFCRSLVTICAERGVDIAVLDTLLNHAAAATQDSAPGRGSGMVQQRVEHRDVDATFGTNRHQTAAEVMEAPGVYCTSRLMRPLARSNHRSARSADGHGTG